ncbi:MAG: UbiA family prenyltransferase [Burkholderiales bacterium]|nr:UbiA family prenyltransferase [Burkholderiales bacterium]
MIALKERLDAYEHLMRLKQPVGFLLILWPTLCALWVAASGAPPISSIMILFTSVLLLRSAGCVLVEWSNRHSPMSPITQNIVSSKEVFLLAIVLCALAFCFICFTTKIAIALFFVMIAFFTIHALLRQVFLLPQVFLAITFSFGIPIAFAITLNKVPWFAWAFIGVNLFWSIAYQIEYMMMPPENRTMKLQSTTITFGRHDIKIIAFCYFCFFAGITFFGIYWAWGWIFWFFMALAIGVAISCLVCIRANDAHRSVRAFQRNHWIGLFLFLGIALNHALQYRAFPLLNQ